MIPQSISLVERQLLINQCRILSVIADEKERDLCEKRIEILEKGYTGLYPKVFSNLYEEVPMSVYSEISDIMKMYSRINESIRLLPDADRELLDLASLEFEGFDQDNGMHYYMMSYLVDRMDEHAEYKGRELKSHKNNSLIKYNRMLSVYFEYEKAKKLQYSSPDLQKFIDEVKSLAADNQQ
ncbi:YfbU family protein [Dyadobacter sp. 676]|uniref:YfbU family protein n=1 Tax=Dyadobacter sp. 676 TaxID=3088362 RepID=A0AAU8FNV7_9BACT